MEVKSTFDIEACRRLDECGDSCQKRDQSLFRDTEHLTAVSDDYFLSLDLQVREGHGTNCYHIRYSRSIAGDLKDQLTCPVTRSLIARDRIRADETRL
jgi:hypothetical protein